jgi:hypothetical protein
MYSRDVTGWQEEYAKLKRSSSKPIKSTHEDIDTKKIAVLVAEPVSIRPSVAVKGPSIVATCTSKRLICASNTGIECFASSRILKKTQRLMDLRQIKGTEK